MELCDVTESINKSCVGEKNTWVQFEEPSKGKVIKIWKEPANSGGYYLHQIEYMSVSHDVQFKTKSNDPISKQIENIHLTITDENDEENLLNLSAAQDIIRTTESPINKVAPIVCTSSSDSDSSKQTIKNTTTLEVIQIDDEPDDVQVNNKLHEDKDTSCIIRKSLNFQTKKLPSSRIEYGQFIRYALLPKYLSLSSSVINLMNRRDKVRCALNPYQPLFLHLDRVSEWDETFLVPETGELTRSIIDQVKKGMMNGKLYNMSRAQLRKIFPKLPSDYQQSSLNKKYIKTRLRCPLCLFDENLGPKVSGLYFHIENVHTSSLLICIHCDMGITPDRSLYAHARKCTSYSDSGSDHPGARLDRDTDIYRFFSARKRSHSSNSERSAKKCKSDYLNGNGGRFTRVPIPKSSNDSDVCKVMNARAMAARTIKPDERFFYELEGIEPWDVHKLIPFPNRLFDSDIKAIKKGMKLGFLYNIGLQWLWSMFPAKIYGDINWNLRKLSCPLCPEPYSAHVDVLYHIEKCHTNFYLVCNDCGREFTESEVVQEHCCT